MIDDRILKDHNLTRDEYKLIVKLVGRAPNPTELGLFSVMWSEHCGYKSSRVHLKKLPTKGPAVIQGPGENAGILDIGDGLAVVFKIESHNHPSFIEPYQGAATGVGGILRDIFTMGARPIAVMDSLRFGPPDQPRNRAIMEGVVSGIAGYGNSFGVPTVGGETSFDAGYAQNPLVNVFCLGLVRKDKIFYARAEGAGNAVLYVGAKTGRDGIHGATMASAEFGTETEHKRPNVQVGDPFKEKLLLEACLEAMGRGLIVGIQDMGAAGLACSTSEIAAKSGLGMDIDLDLVPQREAGMTPYEIMLSESQERMLMVARPGRVAEVQAIFAEWDLDAVVVGRVVEGGRLRVRFHGEEVIDLPVEAIVNLCPALRRPVAKPRPAKPAGKGAPIPPPDNYTKAFLKLLASPTIADKEWIFGQYDHMVQTNTVFLPGADAAVVRIKGSRRALAASLDGNSLHVRLDPRTGGAAAVAEACRNLACVGARPIGITNCLNFGNPEKPEVMGQFEAVIEGMAEACKVFAVPVTGGNVSFYNDTEGASINPTPVVGVVGLIEDVAQAVRPGFKAAGDIVVLLGETKDELGGSEYLRSIHGREDGPAPGLDLALEKRVQELCLEAVGLGLLRSAHDLSEGGLAVALAESCFHGLKDLGCVVELESELRPDALLFGESASRILVSVRPSALDRLLQLARDRKARAAAIGKVYGQSIVVGRAGFKLVDVTVREAHRAWKNAIPDLFKIHA
ncbi:MAG: phosphoribosylformylglycinamidine synthase subunit PurL [Candidatus Aminicenantes bacterium]|nr:phosphoribosylformylglycinamidine synthase subunit PurL [Candidatus Aminicenantes bacterium]